MLSHNVQFHKTMSICFLKLSSSVKETIVTAFGGVRLPNFMLI